MSSRRKQHDMARKYHNLAGLCRDLGTALIADAEGDPEAAKQLDMFDEVLGLLDERCDGEVPVGPEGDDAASGDAAEDEGETMVRAQRAVRGVASVDARGASPAGGQPAGRGVRQRSTRARLAEEARPRPGGQVQRLSGRGGSR